MRGCWHKWSAWSEKFEETWGHGKEPAPDDIIYLLQERACAKCNQIDRRHVTTKGIPD
jgi:hypothetical protein